MSALRRCGWILTLLLTLSSAYADVHFRHFEEEDPDEPKWQEGEVSLPEFPNDEDLREFDVSAVTANRFYVDAKSLTVGSEGVVRFTLVVKTAGGATNVSFEGLRCKGLEYRIYATGRSDRAWVKARKSDWKPIENKPINRYHASLSRYYFCPNGSPIGNAEEGLEALRLGKHPDAQ